MGMPDNKLNKCISTSNIIEKKHNYTQDLDLENEAMLHKKMTILSEVVSKEKLKLTKYSTKKKNKYSTHAPTVLKPKNSESYTLY